MNVTLTGFPPVIRANVIQGVGARPGYAIVDMPVGDIDNYPEVTTLTMTNGSTTLVWSNMRVARAPKVKFGRMRVVLEDSRWKLKQVTMSRNYNSRDGLGNLYSPSQASPSQLATALSAASGITFEAGTTTPDWSPPAQWRGKRADAALDQYLYDAACRCLYNPISQKYKLWSAGEGDLGSFDTRLFAPAPDRNVGGAMLETAPILYEGRLAATAVVDNADGGYEPLDDYDGDGYIDGFADYNGNEMQSRLQQSAFRLWRVNDENKEILPHRALMLTCDPSRPTYASSALVRSDIASQLRQHPVHPAGGDREQLCKTSGNLFWSDDPFLDSNGASFKTTATLLTGYYQITSNARERQLHSILSGGGGNTHVVRAEWIRPFVSSEGIGTSNWDNVVTVVKAAHLKRFQGHPQYVFLAGLATMPESGRIGGVAYYASSRQSMHDVITKVAIDFEPDQRKEFPGAR